MAEIKIENGIIWMGILFQLALVSGIVLRYAYNNDIIGQTTFYAVLLLFFILGILSFITLQIAEKKNMEDISIISITGVGSSAILCGTALRPPGMTHIASVIFFIVLVAMMICILVYFWRKF